MNDLWCRLTLEGTRESVWTCACPRLMESGIGKKLEQNGTIALAFWLKPALCSDYISHAPLHSALMLWWSYLGFSFPVSLSVLFYSLLVFPLASLIISRKKSAFAFLSCIMTLFHRSLYVKWWIIKPDFRHFLGRHLFFSLSPRLLLNQGRLCFAGHYFCIFH